jgi:hypothetical protein
MADENIALTNQPDGGHGQRSPIGIGHEAPHEVDGKTEEWSCFFAYKFAVHCSRTNRFPVEDVNKPGDVVARGKRPQLLADELTECALPRHRLRFLRVRKLILGERVNGVAQHFAVQPILAPEVVIYRRLIDASLRRKGRSANSRVAVFKIRSRVISDGRVISPTLVFKLAFENMSRVRQTVKRLSDGNRCAAAATQTRPRARGGHPG